MPDRIAMAVLLTLTAFTVRATAVVRAVAPTGPAASPPALTAGNQAPDGSDAAPMRPPLDDVDHAPTLAAIACRISAESKDRSNPNPHPLAPYQPPDSQPLEIAIDIRRHRLLLLAKGFPVRQYPVAVGTRSTPSPLGEWRISHKSRNWGGGFGTRWLGLNVPWGIYGIHGTNQPWSVGRNASNGCIRMRNADVEELFDLVGIGTPVTLFGEPELTRRVLVPGHRGADVREVQLRLRELDFAPGPVDGIYGPQMEKAVRRFQRQHGLRETGLVRYDTYRALGLGP